MPRFVGCNGSELFEDEDWEQTGHVRVPNHPTPLGSYTLMAYAIARGQRDSNLGPLYEDLPSSIRDLKFDRGIQVPSANSELVPPPDILTVTSHGVHTAPLTPPLTNKDSWASQFSQPESLGEIVTSNYISHSGFEFPKVAHNEAAASTPKAIKSTPIIVEHGPLAQKRVSKPTLEFGPARSGYLEINGKWIDPDSQQEIFNAMTRPATVKPLMMPGSTTGPHILTDEELKVAYEDFFEDVDADEINILDRDFEGDPRSHRISPETFLKWTEGAVQGERYFEDDLDEPEIPDVPDIPDTPNIYEAQVLSGRKDVDLPKLSVVIPQFCPITGDLMSPILPEVFPVPLEGPATTNELFAPANLSKSVETRGNHHMAISNMIEDDQGDLDDAIAKFTDNDFHDILDPIAPGAYSKFMSKLATLRILVDKSIKRQADAETAKSAIAAQVFQMEKENFLAQNSVEIKAAKAEAARHAKEHSRKMKHLCHAWEMVMDQVLELQDLKNTADTYTSSTNEEAAELRNRGGELLAERANRESVAKKARTRSQRTLSTIGDISQGHDNPDITSSTPKPPVFDGNPLNGSAPNWTPPYYQAPAQYPPTTDRRHPSPYGHQYFPSPMQEHYVDVPSWSPSFHQMHQYGPMQGVVTGLGSPYGDQYFHQGFQGYMQGIHYPQQRNHFYAYSFSPYGQHSAYTGTNGPPKYEGSVEEED